MCLDGIVPDNFFNIAVERGIRRVCDIGRPWRPQAQERPAPTIPF